MSKASLVLLCGLLGIPLAGAQDLEALRPAATAINALGCDLLGQSPGNTLVSPYSIQTALAMTFAGAAGETREEMARVLHFAGEEAALHGAFAALQAELEEVARATARRAELSAKVGGPSDPVVLTVANRLFGQSGYAFRPTFLSLVSELYQAPLQAADFIHQASQEALAINRWVEEQTRSRIRDLIPEGALDAATRLVLVNAVYLKAPWEQPFPERATAPQPFRVDGRKAVEVPTMVRQDKYGYHKADGYTAVTVPYSGRQLQLLILLPDEPDGLPALEKKLSPFLLALSAPLPPHDVKLYLPTFRMEPPLMRLSENLKKLGMKRAFNEPEGSADFDRMAPRLPDDYLFVSEIFHKTFLALDEKGTEAAAATAVVMARATAMRPEPKPEPVEVRVDRPFLFAIQHRASGACLFLGRMNDPR